MAAELILKVRVDKSALYSFQSSIKKGIEVPVKATGATQATKEVNNFANATEKAHTQTQALGNAVSKYMVWFGIGTAISNVAKAFTYAVDTMKGVDTQLTNIAKVSGQTREELQGLADSAYETASKYGVAADEFMASVYEFTKAGYQDTNAQMAELATKAMLVGDTTAAIADKFLIVSDTAWQLGGDVERLSMVLDEADYINNNYATSLDKIAEGFPRAASVASMAGMSIEQTMAALGTIQATTQETASKTGTALRALILNILGDTSTEIEDGVTATEESVEKMRQVLEKYAPDVVKAADATKTLINPMEALAVLAEKYQQGLISEVDMFAIESGLGGKLRTNQLDALLKNFDMYEEMLGGMATAAGTADAEIDMMLTSWEAKTHILANTWTDFVQKSLDSDIFKGFIDGLTGFLNAFGDLHSLLIAVGGAFLALKLPALSNHFTALSKSAKSAATEIKNTATAAESLKNVGPSGVGAMQIAIAAVTVMIEASLAAMRQADQVLEQYEAGLADAAKSATEQASSAIEEQKTVDALYESYLQAQKAYDSGKGAKEDYQAASDNLAAALGIEKESVDNLSQSYEELIEKQKQQTQNAIEAEKSAVTQQIIARQNISATNEAMPGWAEFGLNLTGGGLGSRMRMLSALAMPDDPEAAGIDLDEMVSKYRQAVSNIASIDKRTGKSRSVFNELPEWIRDGYNEAKDFVSQYGDLLAPLKELEDQEILLRPEIETTGAIEQVDELAEAYESLAGRAAEATGALEEYDLATKTLRGDDFKKLASVYEDFLTDYEKGLVDSTKVRAALPTFFTDEMLIDMRRQGVDAAEFLASDFFQSFFTYMDSEGERQFTKGEDMGSLFAFSLFDDAAGDNLAEGYKRVGNEIRGVNDELVASFTQTFDESGAESIDLMVEDLDMLGDALKIDPSMLAVILDTLGVYHPEIEENAEGIKALAESYGALSGQANIVDTTAFVEGLKEAGKSADEAGRYLDRMVELASNNQLAIDIDVSSAEHAKEKINEILESVYTSSEEEVPVIAPSVDTQQVDEAKRSVEEIKMSAKNISEERNYLPMEYDQVTGAYNEVQKLRNEAEAVNNTLYTVKVTADTSQAQQEIAKVASAKQRLASGTTNAKGGLTLVNEGGGPEIIVEDGIARIAGGGKPTLTILQAGATVFNAKDTRAIFQNSGIQAFAGGTAKGITRWTAENASGKSKKPSSGRSSGGGSGRSSSSNNSDPELQRLKDIIALLESELALMKARGDSTKAQILKLREIQGAVQNQINYMKSIGASQIEINNLTQKWYDLNKDIADLQNEMIDNLSEGISTEIDKLNEKRDEELAALDEQYKTKEDQLELEEKILAVQEAEAALAKAQNERTIRYYNALTGQWEWGYDASKVKSAEDKLKSAQEALADAEYDFAKDEINARYDAQEKLYKDFMKALEEPAITLAEAIKELSANATKAMASDIDLINSWLQTLSDAGLYSGAKINKANLYDSGGVLQGMGGIKATAEDEMVLPPELTRQMLKPVSSGVFRERLAELSMLYGGTAKLGSGRLGANSIAEQYNGNVYKYGNVTLTEEQARRTSVYDFVQYSKSLGLYSSTR